MGWDFQLNLITMRKIKVFSGKKKRARICNILLQNTQNEIIAGAITRRSQHNRFFNSKSYILTLHIANESPQVSNGMFVAGCVFDASFLVFLTAWPGEWPYSKNTSDVKSIT